MMRAWTMVPMPQAEGIHRENLKHMGGSLRYAGGAGG